ncbi:MAG: TetR/AcrR family transcriptional regulator [Nitrospira sp.]|nr:TetR/AcrR family transcriptional regulator [Nitrospira sp.]
MVSCIPKIANEVLLFRVSHKLGLTSYHEVFDLIDIVAITYQQGQALMQSCLSIERRATVVSVYSPAMNNIVRPARQQPVRTSSHQRQASLISAAASLFATKGFRGTTTKQIALAAGVSEALLFKHFPTKHALYSAILSEKTHYSGLQESLEEAAAKREDKRLFMLLASYRIRKGADPILFRLLLFSALEGHAMSDMFFQQQYRVFHDLLAGYIRQRIDEGAYRPVDPVLAARAFFGIIVHHRLLHDILGLPMHLTHEATVEEYVSLFLNGLLRQ